MTPLVYIPLVHNPLVHQILLNILTSYRLLVFNMKINRLVIGVVLIVLALVVLDLMVAFLNPPNDGDGTITGDGTYSTHVSLMGEDTIEGEFTVTKGTTINFFICDEDNFKKYSDSKSYADIEKYELMEDADSGSFDFETPKGDSVLESVKWYVVFDVRDSGGNETIVAYEMEFLPYQNAVYYMKVILILVGIVDVVLAFKSELKESFQEKSRGKQE